MNQHIESFNYFINVEMSKVRARARGRRPPLSAVLGVCGCGMRGGLAAQIVAANSTIRSDADAHFFLEYERIHVGDPSTDEDLVERNVTPNQCRLRDMTYSAPVYVDMRYVRRPGFAFAYCGCYWQLHSRMGHAAGIAFAHCGCYWQLHVREWAAGTRATATSC